MVHSFRILLLYFLSNRLAASSLPAPVIVIVPLTSVYASLQSQKIVHNIEFLNSI